MPARIFLAELGSILLFCICVLPILFEGNLFTLSKTPKGFWVYSVIGLCLALLTPAVRYKMSGMFGEPVNPKFLVALFILVPIWVVAFIAFIASLVSLRNKSEIKLLILGLLMNLFTLILFVYSQKADQVLSYREHEDLQHFKLQLPSANIEQSVIGKS
jgi:hypothetical protein